MNPDDANKTRPDDAGREIEQPIAALMELESETSADFIGQVRRRIYRRTSVSQFAAYSWLLPKIVLIEMASVLGHLFKGIGKGKESRP